ncbi:MAG: c-type cytochrome [Jannaschia sp.]
MRILLSLLVLSACVGSELPTEADVGAARGLSLFEQNCAACHGATGQGGLGPDLTLLSRRADGTFPRDRVMAQIDGLARHGDGDAVMPEFGADGLGDTVIVEHDGIGTPVPADLLALTTYLETIQR